MRLPITCLVPLVCLVCAVSPTHAASKVADVNEPSRGDPKVFVLMARQGFESGLLKRGSTLAKLCTIRSDSGAPAYTLYWFYHLTQAAEQVHGRAELVAISAVGNVLGRYDYEGTDKPRCAGGKVYPVDDDLSDDPARYVTTFAPDQLPKWLGDGGQFFPVTRYERASSVDGIRLPRTTQ
jgi:hypothetical protein